MAEHYLGYNFTSPILGNFVPQRVQNLCIRDYARAQGLTLTFTVSEYFDARQALMLFAQLDHENVRGFIFYSLLLLPADHARRRMFYERVAQKNLVVHFALETLVMRSPADREPVDRMYRIGTDARLEQTREELIRMRAAPR